MVYFENTQRKKFIFVYPFILLLLSGFRVLLRTLFLKLWPASRPALCLTIVHFASSHIHLFCLRTYKAPEYEFFGDVE